ncbi:MAG: hypothetical protein D6698_16290 [Gammaproteobacteria bacterium]|nr:MAG: hypothetical protein D6698_16290 [Gammaproteobacteria bacterium]
MNHPENEPQIEVAEVRIEQIEWPAEFGNDISPMVLKWLISPHLTEPAAALCRQGRIHVMRKPRARQDRYLVFGGLQAYLHMLQSEWHEKTMVLIRPEISIQEAEKAFMEELQLMLYGLRSCPVAAASKAAILMRLAKGPNFIIKAPNRMIKRGNQALLKEVCGYDRRSYMRTRKDGVPESLIQWVDSVLGSAAKKDDELECHGS